MDYRVQASGARCPFPTGIPGDPADVLSRDSRGNLPSKRGEVRFKEQPECLDARQEYLSLRQAIDDFAAMVSQKHGEHIQCRRGCIQCCVPPETLFRIEGEEILKAVAGLPAPLRECIRDRIERGEDLECPLLEEGGCMIYENRPILCRTQGMPLAVHREGKVYDLEYCRLNFTEVPSDFELPRRHILDIEGTNEILATLNLKLVGGAGLDPEQDGRVSFRRAALGKLQGVPTPVEGG